MGSRQQYTNLSNLSGDIEDEEESAMASAEDQKESEFQVRTDHTGAGSSGITQCMVNLVNAGVLGVHCWYDYQPW